MIREVILKEMAHRKMRQSKLSDLSGVSRNQVSKFFKGKSLSIDNLEKILDVLDLKLNKTF